MNIQRLTHREFLLTPSVSNPNILTMCTRVKGLSLVLFHSNNCPVSTFVKQWFCELTTVIQNVILCIVDIEEHLNKNIVIMSRQAQNPLTVTPTIIIYYNGYPKYLVENNIAIKDFIDIVRHVITLLPKPRKRKNCAENAGIYLIQQSAHSDLINKYANIKTNISSINGTVIGVGPR